MPKHGASLRRIAAVITARAAENKGAMRDSHSAAHGLENLRIDVTKLAKRALSAGNVEMWTALDYYVRAVREAAEGRRGADRMAAGLPALPLKRRRKGAKMV